VTTPPHGAENRRTLRRLTLAAAAVAALTFASLPAALGSAAHARTADAMSLQQGKSLYRKYCGQCHALRAALAAGFGSNNGLGTDGGPSFDGLRVPFNLSVLAVTQPFIGHERLVHKMTWAEVKVVARYVETVTRHHPVLAQPIDG
jgi:mono/diheme cytochrome c family protein